MRARPAALLLLAALAALAAAAGAAAAQAPFPNHVEARAEGSLPEAGQGSVVPVVFAVALNATAACAEPGMAVVELALATEAPGVEFEAQAPRITAQVPAGVHGVAGLPAHEASGEWRVVVLVAELAEPGEHAASLRLASAGVEGCPGHGLAPWEGKAELGFRVRERPREQVEHPEHEEHGEAGFDLFLEPGASRETRFNVTGRFPYHDHFRPELRGLVAVEPEGAARADVRVTAEGFEPAEVRVGKGGTVRWTNADKVPHTVSADELHPGEGGEHAGEGAGGNASPEPGPGGPAGEPAEPSQPARRAPGAWEAALLLAALLVGLAARRR